MSQHRFKNTRLVNNSLKYISLLQHRVISGFCMPLCITGCWTSGSAALQGLQFRSEIGRECPVCRPDTIRIISLDLPEKYFTGRAI